MHVAGRRSLENALSSALDARSDILAADKGPLSIMQTKELRPNQSGNRIFTTSTAPYQALLIVEPNQIYVWMFDVATQFTAYFSVQEITDDSYYYYGTPYNAHVSANFMLDDTQLYEQLQ